MTAPSASIQLLVDHYRDQLAGAYGLAKLGDHGPAADMAQRLVEELGHRPDNVLAQMVVVLLDPAARAIADRMVHSVYARAARCPDPDVHAQLERAAAQELRLPPMTPPGHCTWCGGSLAQPGGTQ